ncbi:hypothetical protein POL68_39635 [Stigmatella sp. ncwal1]|uniref:Tetratricopeptide repeat protein n=1 Tax=Stigmatella ashevillensis TaxID=2995309 RepID=A0ABT5DNA5_9BACT|nr:hypothetical protein [Stigmatella ashevillena]MDC0714628.1 hypothetical protein [Stigmatella ashevillena]
MAHLSPAELMERLHAAREAGKEDRGNPVQLQLHRELAESCPAFAPNLLHLSRTLLVSREPVPEDGHAFAEAQRLLEQAVQLSERSAPSLVELAYLHDSIYNDFKTARPLYEEGAARALAALEDAWAGLLTSFILERQLPEALELAQRAWRVFPESARIMHRVHEARELAIAAGMLPPDPTDP